MMSLFERFLTRVTMALKLIFGSDTQLFGTDSYHVSLGACSPGVHCNSYHDFYVTSSCGYIVKGLALIAILKLLKLLKDHSSLGPILKKKVNQHHLLKSRTSIIKHVNLSENTM